MELIAENVERIFMDCLFKEKEDVTTAVKVEGIVSKFGFHPKRLAEHKDDIYSMLTKLPKEFQQNGGGGMSFLNACNDKDGHQWTGLHRTMEQLFVLGLAIEKVKSCMPRLMWNMLPGSMPYYVVM